MQKLSLLWVSLLLLVSSVATKAQQAIQDPTTWTYEVKKLSANEYELVFHVTLTRGWHIFSQKPGDEFLIPPSFNFKKNGDFTLVGNVREDGALITRKFEGIDKPVSFYEAKVDFIQKVQVKGHVKISGEQEYQVCNDNLCLPPKKKGFEFEIR